MERSPRIGSMLLATALPSRVSEVCLSRCQQASNLQFPGVTRPQAQRRACIRIDLRIPQANRFFALSESHNCEDGATLLVAADSTNACEKRLAASCVKDAMTLRPGKAVGILESAVEVCSLGHAYQTYLAMKHRAWKLCQGIERPRTTPMRVHKKIS
jgi:hypothetical protein